MRRTAIGLALLLVACSADQTEETTTTVTSTTSTTLGTTTTTSTLPDIRDELRAAEQRIDQLEAELSTATLESNQAATALEDALAEINRLLLAYDPEIQQSLAAGVDDIVVVVCTAIDEDTIGTSVESFTQAEIVIWGQQPGLPSGASDALDVATIEERVAQCVAEAEVRGRQAELTEPKSSGVYNVGVDIAPGTWQAEPDKQDCYWERTNAQGEIIDNHFGSTGAGLTVAIRSSDYSVEFSGCGEWTYLG